MTYSSPPQVTISSYNHHSQQHSNIYGIQNYSYQTSSSFYQPQISQQQQQQPQQPPPPQQQQISSSYSISNYSPSNGLLSTTTSLPQPNFYSQEDNVPILDL